MKIIRYRAVIILLIISGLFAFASCTSSNSNNEGIKVSFEIPRVLKDSSLGSTFPEIAYESESLLIFYNYMGVFIYDLENSKMLTAIRPKDLEFNLNTQGDPATVAYYNNSRETISIYKIGNHIPEYFYVYDIGADKLFQYSKDQLNVEGEPTVSGRMESDDWSAWNLIYISYLTGKSYYPFRSIAE